MPSDYNCKHKFIMLNEQILPVDTYLTFIIQGVNRE